MALIAYDGFDNYANGADIANRRSGGMQWNYVDASLVAGRKAGGSAAAIGQNGILLGTLGTPLKTGIFGFAMNIATSNNPGEPLLDLFDMHAPGNVGQLRFVFNIYTASINIFRFNADGGLVPIASTPNNTFTLDSWNYIEFLVTIDSAHGAIIMRCNGQTLLNASGLNTQNSANAWYEALWFRGAGAPTGTYLLLDDLYFADTTTGAGAFPFNYFAGDVTVQTLYPVANVGTQGWTPLAQTNWQEVSEIHADGDASYNATNTPGAADRFRFGPLSGTITQILAVQLTGAYRKDDAGTRVVQQQIVSGGVQQAATGYSIPNVYVYCCDIFTADPATGGAWTTGAVNALTAGYTLAL